MNSFNHYAYGAVADWVYTVAAGIQTVEEKPGYAAVRIAPQPDKRLDWLEASVETRHGLVCSPLGSSVICGAMRSKHRLRQRS